MIKSQAEDIRWDFLSRIIIFSFFALQIVRWQILPQFMDIYYHLSVAWGFLQAGGYSGWDFWQYAPMGRVHIYPPFFHLVLAGLIKLGISKIILAKVFETIMPLVFLLTTWFFVRAHYTKRLAFFVLLSVASSYSFYMGLINHIPATLAIIFGIISFGQLLKNRFMRSALFLAICFYTHIGISWFFTLSIILYGLFNKDYARLCFRVFILGIILSLPVILTQLGGTKFISHLGINLSEKYSCHFKIVEYFLALFGLVIAIKNAKKYYLFLSLFIASFIFLTYPFRFFSAEGYLPIIFLSALALDGIYNQLKIKPVLKYVSILLIMVFALFISPTLLREKPIEEGGSKYAARFNHTALMGLFFPENQGRGFFNYIWFAYSPEKYLSGAKIIRENSDKDDIVYCNLNLLGLCLSSLAERATANGLFPEIKPKEAFDPILNSKILVLTKDIPADFMSEMASYYKLEKIGENELFVIYKNTVCQVKMKVHPAIVPFWLIGLVCVVFVLLYKKQ